MKVIYNNSDSENGMYELKKYCLNEYCDNDDQPVFDISELTN